MSLTTGKKYRDSEIRFKMVNARRVIRDHLNIFKVKFTWIESHTATKQ